MEAPFSTITDIEECINLTMTQYAKTKNENNLINGACDNIENKILSEFLDTADTLEKLIDYCKKNESQIDNQILTMSKKAHKSLIHALAKNGVKQMDVKCGDELNLKVHRLTEADKNSARSSSVVKSIVKNGYLLNSNVMRPATVLVDKKKKK